MPVSHALAGNPSPALFSSSAFESLQQFLMARQQAVPVDSFERFEIELHAMVVQVEREILASELAKLDVDVPVIEIEGDDARGSSAASRTTSRRPARSA